ncbi:MAG: MoaD/ThiS family protein [Candidatus Thalassarchaeaceae archaeon]|nr:MoaD/ThiS family protein [Candidatus Thalassarchaeaceae archaeon]
MDTYQITLFGPLRERFGANKLNYSHPSSNTVRSLLESLDIEPDLVKVALDGVISELDQELGNTSEIAILPPVSGG